MTLLSEIREQPDVLDRLLHDQLDAVRRIAREIRAQAPEYAFLAARGTSDNAGRYANYLWGALNQMPVALATPSLFTLYDCVPRLSGALVMGISQSGQSPDIVRVLQEGRQQGRPTLVITNEPDSPLANAAEWVVDIQAGAEMAVAATKTYTAELMAIAMLSVAMQDDETLWETLHKVPGWIRTVLQQEEQIAHFAERYRYMERCVVLGRGYNYCTAFEWSLKLKELTYVVAEPYSTADFQHGPIAIVEHGFPIMAVSPSGKVYDSNLPLLRQLREQQEAELLVISDQAEALGLAQSPVVLPSGIPEWLSPLVSIVPAQLFACHLTQVKGFNTESPRSIHKVTSTN